MHVANEPASESAPGKHRPPERPLFEPPRIRRPDEGERPTAWLMRPIELYGREVIPGVRALLAAQAPESADEAAASTR